MKNNVFKKFKTLDLFTGPVKVVTVEEFLNEVQVMRVSPRADINEYYTVSPNPPTFVGNAYNGYPVDGELETFKKVVPLAKRKSVGKTSFRKSLTKRTNYSSDLDLNKFAIEAMQHHLDRPTHVIHVGDNRVALVNVKSFDRYHNGKGFVTVCLRPQANFEIYVPNGVKSINGESLTSSSW